MQDAMDDIVKLGMSSAVSWAFLWASTSDRRKTLVCAECGHLGDPVQPRWGRSACAVCGEKRLVSTDSPMAAGHWQSRSRPKASAAALPPPQDKDGGHR